MIGNGSFGECRDCVSLNSNVVYAVKVVEASNEGGAWSTMSIYKREVEFLRSLDHENVVRFVDTYNGRSHLYIITEKCTGGELFDRLIQLKRFKENDAIDIIQQVFCGLEYIHSEGVIHRDLKAENILFAHDGTVKLIDFGLAARVTSDGHTLSAIVGSAHYLAPEMIRQRYSYQVDIWSAGVLLYLLLVGKYPFDGENDDQIIRRIKRGEIDWKSNYLSSGATQFLLCLLEKDTQKRLTASQALDHPFLDPLDEEMTQADDSSPSVDLDVKENQAPGDQSQYGRISRKSSTTERIRKLAQMEVEFNQANLGRRLSRTATHVRIGARAPGRPLGVAALVSPNKYQKVV